VETGQGILSDLRDLLSKADAGVFIRSVVQTGRHAVRYLDVIAASPAEPPSWKPLVWEYDAVTFIAAQASSRALAAALAPGDAQVLPLGGFDLTLPVLAGQVSWQHRPSRARYDSITLPWPTTIFESYLPGGPGQEQRAFGYLIGDDCPSFPSYDTAFRAFFYGDYSGAPGGQVPSNFATVRLVDRRAWLEKVRITPASLEVRLDGDAIAGIRVELNGATYRCDIRATETGQVTIPLPDGLPPNAWLYLSRDRQWLDYRAIGEYTVAAELARAGVDVEVPEDPESEIQALMSRGEGLQVEFKRQLPEDGDESKRTIFKTVAAFANGHGGSLVFGIEKDEATVCGLDGVNLITERDRLAQLARSIVTPAPEVEVRSYEHDGKTLIVLFVSRGTNPPYGITLPGKQNKPVEFYVRRDATTFPARADEIRNAVLATASPSPSTPPWAYQRPGG
jgi:hypothetical protein